MRCIDFELAGFGKGVEERVLRGEWFLTRGFMRWGGQQAAALGLILPALVEESISAQEVP